MLNIISFLTGRKIVHLLHHDGDWSRTIEENKVCPFSARRKCYVYWLYKIGLVILNKDGTTSGRSYIVKWKYEK